MKRSAIKKVTRISKILRYMRVSKDISMRDAGARSGLSDSAISHYEHGRMDISRERIEQLVKAYGYTVTDYLDFMAGKEIPILSVKDECVAMLSMIEERKLKTVHGVLQGFLT